MRYEFSISQVKGAWDSVTKEKFTTIWFNDGLKQDIKTNKCKKLLEALAKRQKDPSHNATVSFSPTDVRPEEERIKEKNIRNRKEGKLEI